MSFNNSTFLNKSVPSPDACKAAYDFYFLLIVQPLSALIGVVLNMLSIIVFSRPDFMKKRNNNNMNYYLLSKSACNAFQSLNLGLTLFIDCSTDCFGVQSPSAQIFNWIYTRYLSYIAKLASMFLEAMATIECYASISRRLQFLRKIKCWMIIAVIFLVCSFFYIFKFFQYDYVVSVDSKTNEVRYLLVSSKRTVNFSNFVLVHSLLRDFVSVLVIMIFNILTIHEIRAALMHKRTISKTHSKKLKNKGTEKRLALMVISTGVMIAIGHLPTFLKNFLNYSNLHCVTFAVDLGFNIAYSFQFFFYLYFDNLFRETFTGLINKLLTCFRICRST